MRKISKQMYEELDKVLDTAVKDSFDLDTVMCMESEELELFRHTANIYKLSKKYTEELEDQLDRIETKLNDLLRKVEA